MMGGGVGSHSILRGWVASLLDGASCERTGKTKPWFTVAGDQKGGPLRKRSRSLLVRKSSFWVQWCLGLSCFHLGDLYLPAYLPASQAQSSNHVFTILGSSARNVRT
jgi:hypothetical protein